MLINMILDPVLMFVLKLGFIGAGYATLIGQIIGCILLSLSAIRNSKCSIKIKDVKFNIERIYHILAGGMPNFSRQGITSLSLVLVNKTAAAYGEGIIAALTVSSRVIALAYMIMIGFGQGFQPVCAMNYGAKKYRRVKEAFKTALIIGTLFLVFCAVVIFIFPVNFISIMSRDGEVILTGSKILRMQCITLPFLGYYAMSSMLMQNTGKYFNSLLISVARQGIFYIPLLYILTAFYGKFGIYLLQPSCDMLSFVLAFVIMYKKSKDIFI